MDQTMRRLFRILRVAVVAACAALGAPPAAAAPFAFSNGNVDGRMASGSRPAGAGRIEIETADDFVLAQATRITSLTFTGLVPVGASVGAIVLEMYRVFPLDSNTARSPAVPTRANSPSDVAFASRSGSDFSFATTTLATSFTAGNSVLNGINKAPNQTTGGEGPVTGQEVLFTVELTTPFDLPADHYFFVPQVRLSSGDFLWLSSVRPVVAPGTPFAPDLQSWIRNANLDPDWLRIGTDIVGGTTFNAAFTLGGVTIAAVPEPSDAALFALGAVVLVARRGRRRG